MESKEKEFLLPVRYSYYKLVSVKSSDLQTAINNTIASFVPEDPDVEPGSVLINEKEAQFLNGEF